MEDEELFQNYIAGLWETKCDIGKGIDFVCMTLSKDCITATLDQRISALLTLLPNDYN